MLNNKKCYLYLALIFLIFSPLKAAQLPVEAYSSLPVMSMVRISPDGGRIAFRAVRNEEDYLIAVSYTHLTLPTIA